MSKTDADCAREIKLCMLGETQVGKTSLVVRFAKGKFNEYSEPTIGASFMTKRMMFNEAELKYNIWDTAGQERFKGIASLYYRSAAAVIVVYDITEELSFGKLDFWVKEVEKEGSQNVVIVIAGNKLDKETERKIPKEKGQQYADSIGALFFEVSAKTSENVDLLFREMSKTLPPERETPRKPNYGLPQDNTRNASNNSSCC